MSTALAMFAPTITGFRLRRSIHAPRNGPGITVAAMRAATSRPVSVAPAPRTSTAVSGKASSVIWLPRRETVYADQSLTNSGWRQGEAINEAGRALCAVARDDLLGHVLEIDAPHIGAVDQLVPDRSRTCHEGSTRSGAQCPGDVPIVRGYEAYLGDRHAHQPRSVLVSFASRLRRRRHRDSPRSGVALRGSGRRMGGTGP